MGDFFFGRDPRGCFRSRVGRAFRYISRALPRTGGCRCNRSRGPRKIFRAFSKTKSSTSQSHCRISTIETSETISNTQTRINNNRQDSLRMKKFRTHVAINVYAKSFFNNEFISKSRQNSRLIVHTNTMPDIGV